MKIDYTKGFKKGDLVKFKGDLRMGIVTQSWVIPSNGSKEYSVRWFPYHKGRSRVVENLLELVSPASQPKEEELE